MHSKLILSILGASLVSAQTFTDCDPTKGDKCEPDPAFARQVAIDYTGGADSTFELAEGTKLKYDEEKGAVFSCATENDAPTISSPEYIFFGELEVEMMAAPGAGIVTSIVLQSDCLDEIDWEWTGGEPNKVQSNYFSKGNTETFDRGGTHDAPNSMTEFHTYKLVWTQEKLDWIIDGNTVRTLKYTDAKGGKEFPQTPMQVKLGTWVAGKKDAPEGTKEWAGGEADFSKGATHAYYKRISITDYAGGVEGAKSYVYGDETGTWESIVVDTKSGDLKDVKKKEKDGDSKSDDAESTSSSDSYATDSVSKPTAPSTPGAGSTEVPSGFSSGAASTTWTVASIGLSLLASLFVI